MNAFVIRSTNWMKNAKNKVIKGRKITCIIRTCSMWFMLGEHRTTKHSHLREWEGEKNSNFDQSPSHVYWCPSSTEYNCRFPFDLSDSRRTKKTLIAFYRKSEPKSVLRHEQTSTLACLHTEFTVSAFATKSLSICDRPS